MFDRLIVRELKRRRYFAIHTAILASVKGYPKEFPMDARRLSFQWRASGRRSFYFPSISFLSGFPSAFPLILKRERSLARAVLKRVAVAVQAAHGSVEVPTGSDDGGGRRTTVREG